MTPPTRSWRTRPSTSGDEQDSVTSAANCACRDLSIERCEFSTERSAESDKVGVSHLIAAQYRVIHVEQAHCVGLESVSVHGAHAAKARHGDVNGLGIGVVRMTHNSHNSVFGYRDSNPVLTTVGEKPLVGPLMMDVRRIDQGNECVDIKEAGRHDDSSRSLLTSSNVAPLAPAFRGSNEIPLRTAC